MKKLMMFAAVLIALVSDAAVTITGVTARQRWPWNSLVDVDFTIAGAAAGEKFLAEITAECADGDKKLAASMYVNEPIARPGANRVTWAMGVDYPNFRAEDLRVSVSVRPFTAETRLHLVIDLSSGKDAVTYPVYYTTAPLPHVQGGMDETCQTTQLWLRRVPAAGRVFSSGYSTPTASNNTWWWKLTKDFYIGVFETTQQQWFQLTGKWPSCMSNLTYRASRPLDRYDPTLLFKTICTWSEENQTIAADSLLQKLRDRTGLAKLNLPTETQWQFAACGGTMTTPESACGNVSVYNGYTKAEVARYGTSSEDYEDGLCGTNSGSACVGSYKPNAYGLYDMIGNVFEDCLESFLPAATLSAYYAERGAKDSATPLTDSQGIPIDTIKELHEKKYQRMIKRGGSYGSGAGYITLWQRNEGYLNYANDGTYKSRGVRFCVTCD